MDTHIKISVDNIDAVTFPLKPLVCLRLDRKITGLIVQTIGGKETVDLTNLQSIKVENIVNNFVEAMDSLSDSDYLDVVLALLSTTQIIKGKNTIQIDSEDSFNNAFSGVNPLTIYKILLKIMEENKFTPFVLAEDMGLFEAIKESIGNQTEEINS